MKIYLCKCHVCGVEFEYESEFLYNPLQVLGNDGEPRIGQSCGEHSAEEIRAAYLGVVAA